VPWSAGSHTRCGTVRCRVSEQDRIIVARLAVKPHRCSTKWKVGPCWRVQKAPDEQGIDYEVVKGPARPGKRVDLQRLSAQNLYPVIELENGSIYREESKDMAATIRAGKLDEKRGAAG
jgi:hypothetical protein